MAKIVTLAIETSCDDTSLGIVEYEDGFFSNPLLKAYSQVPDHQHYGGVVPEVAYRLHEEKILDIIKEIGYNLIEQCDFITVTKEPGLPGSLVVGNTVATMLGEFFNKPVYRVNHIYGHIFSLLLDRNCVDCPLPRLVLTASGGHNEMYTVQSKKLKSEKAKMGELENGVLFVDLEITKIGYSLDDAAGECYDKVSRMLGGSYPGGPWIDIMSKKGTGNEKFRLKRILLDGKNIAHTNESRLDNILNFSFSGMKSQVYQLLQRYPLETLSEQDICDIAWEFSECVTDILVQKIRWAADRNHSKTFGVVGGVSASDSLHRKVNDFLPTLRPTKKVYSTDNAAMIGVVGILEYLDCIEGSGVKIIGFLSGVITNLPDKINVPLLYESLTHKSYAIEQKKPVLHNQRLEFLGDSILGLIIAHALYADFPDFDEAQMTLWKISLVREENLYDVCKDIQLNEYLLLGAGEERKGGKDNPAILADALEAFIGYIYLDLGFEMARDFVMRYVYTKKETILLVGNKSRKSLLQEKIQGNHKTLPQYNTQESDRDDSKNYVLYKSTATLGEKILGVGYGENKKKAEENAAKNALES